MKNLPLATSIPKGEKFTIKKSQGQMHDPDFNFIKEILTSECLVQLFLT